MSRPTTPNQQLLDLLGITGENITRVSIECSGEKFFPTVTVTSYLDPLVIKDGELQTDTAHFQLVPVEDKLQAEPEPVDTQAMADAARASCAAYIERRAAYHLDQYKKSCRAAYIRNLLKEFTTADRSLGHAYERRTTRQVVISGGSRIGKSWIANLFDGWISPVAP